MDGPKGISLLRQLNERKLKAEAKIAYWKRQKSGVEENLTKHMNQLTAIVKKIESIEGRSIQLSKHAVERYQLRIENIPEQQILENVLTEQFKNMVRTLGVSGSYPVEGGLAIIADGIIVTFKNRNVDSSRNLGAIGKKNNRQLPIKDE